MSFPSAADLGEALEANGVDGWLLFDFYLNFGHGRHVCLGKNLALLESRVALEEFLVRFPAYEVEESGIEQMHSSNVRGFSALPIRY